MLNKKNHRKFRKVLYIIIFIVYIVIVLYITLFNRVTSVRLKMLTPFWEYKQLIYGVDKLYWFRQIVCNIIMLLPLGTFLCLMYRRLNAIHIGAIGCAFSSCIELTQYVTGRGLLEFDDIFHNTLGAVIGYIIMKRLLMRINKMSEK